MKVHPTVLEAKGAKLAQRDLTVGQHDGSVISCVGTDCDLRLYVRSVVLEMSFRPGPLVRKNWPPSTHKFRRIDSCSTVERQ